MELTTPRSRARLSGFPRLDSIRNRIIVFAVVAMLVPTGATLAIAYAQNRRALEEKIRQNLLSESAQTARAVSVWLKERLYDLRVFAGSEEVANHLESAARGQTSSPAQSRLRDYLVSLNERFSVYGQLMVLDLEGRVLATSDSAVSPVDLPADWLTTLRAESQFVGSPYWDTKTGNGKLLVAVPVRRAGGQLLGAFAAELNLTPVQELLRSFSPDTAGAIYVMSTNGSLIASSSGISPLLIRTQVPPTTLGLLMNQTGTAPEYISFRGREVIGTLERVPQVDWAVVAEISTEAAFRQLRDFRNYALLIVAALLLVVAVSAYWLGHFIARPLDQLTRGAAKVAAGDLDVDLPAGGGGEVGYLTSVFNNMVARLREGRQELDTINETLQTKNEELERLSITDGLTGLANHRLLIQRLDEEGIRAGQYKHEFSVLMADVDHFKEYNDEFGHPAGDEVLKRVANILRESSRPVDCAARYGGEEFAVVMPETPAAEAFEIAEHIRARVAAETFSGRKITLSIGVAEFPSDADDPKGIIAAADKALYSAKRDGRNRTVRARKTSKAGS